MKASLKDVFAPKFFSCIKDYTKAQFTTDLMAGIIVGIVAIPLAIAFGIASGVGPTEGLVTAIVAGLLIALFGGSKVQIGGPTGAFIVIIYGIIQEYGLSGAGKTKCGGSCSRVRGRHPCPTLNDYRPSADRRERLSGQSLTHRPADGRNALRPLHHSPEPRQPLRIGHPF